MSPCQRYEGENSLRRVGSKAGSGSVPTDVKVGLRLGRDMTWVTPDFEVLELGCEVTLYAYTR